MFFLKNTSLRWFLTYAEECKCVNWEVVGGAAWLTATTDACGPMRRSKYSSEKQYQQSQLAELNVAYLLRFWLATPAKSTCYDSPLSPNKTSCKHPMGTHLIIISSSFVNFF